MRPESFAMASIFLGAFLAHLSSANAINTGPDEQKATLDPDFEHFVIEKRALEKQIADKYAVSVPPVVWSFFDAAKKGQWQTTSNH